jgi:hypothetical protein
MRHRLSAHDTRKLWRIGHASDLPTNRFKASHDHREQVVEVVSNAASKLTDSLELLGLMQRCLCLSPTRDFFRDTLFERGIELLESERRSGHIFPCAIERFSEIRRVNRRLLGGAFSGQDYLDPCFRLQQLDQQRQCRCQIMPADAQIPTDKHQNRPSG